jgi:hypothetical protein
MPLHQAGEGIFIAAGAEAFQQFAIHRRAGASVADQGPDVAKKDTHLRAVHEVSP